ncbi:hypothetical protein EMCRGX_G013677 [Ephydatia muelleri]
MTSDGIRPNRFGEKTLKSITKIQFCVIGKDFNASWRLDMVRKVIDIEQKQERAKDRTLRYTTDGSCIFTLKIKDFSLKVQVETSTMAWEIQNMLEPSHDVHFLYISLINLLKASLVYAADSAEVTYVSIQTVSTNKSITRGHTKRYTRFTINLGHSGIRRHVCRDEASVLHQIDVVLIAFNVDCEDSYESVRDAWLPEIKQHCPNIPWLLLGLKADLRFSSEPYIELRRRANMTEKAATARACIPEQAARDMAKELAVGRPDS